MAGIAPGLDGYIAAQQLGQQRQQAETGALMQLLQVQNQMEQAAQAREMRPLQMEALRSQIATRNAAEQQAQRQQAAQGALSSLLATGGYQGALAAPTAVASNDAEALRMVQEAEAQGRPMGVNVPNPQNVKALTSMAFPAEFGKAQAAALFPKPATVAPSAISRLISERDALPAGDPRREIYENALSKQTTHTPGTTVNVSPNGPLVPGKTAATKIDEGLLDVGMRLQSLSSIQNQFKPEYQQIGTKLNTAVLSGQDKLGISLKPEDRNKLTEFSQFKRNSVDAMNQYIKSVTGAAMSEAEAGRIIRGLPNPGTSLFDGDSPVEFKAKLDDAIKMSKMAEARFVYMKRNGMSLSDAAGNPVISLDQMPSVMNKRGGEIEAEIKARQPNMNNAELRRMVRRNLAQEFGLVE